MKTDEKYWWLTMSAIRYNAMILDDDKELGAKVREIIAITEQTIANDKAEQDE